MLSRLLRQFLYSIVHLVVNIIIALQNAYYRFWFKKYSLSDREVTKNDLQMIVKYIPRLTKHPKHLIVLADTDHHSFSELARLVIWSLVAGIPYLSFHDITGNLQKNDEKLFLEVEKNKKGVPGCVKWSNKPDLNGYTNGLAAHMLIVNIFTNNDGRPTIAQCIRQAAEGKKPYHRRSSELDVQEFGNMISSSYPAIPDPDLVLFSGPKCCTYGLLPWQIRLTEFIQLSLDFSVNIEGFIGALYKYSKCDQRFGK